MFTIRFWWILIKKKVNIVTLKNSFFHFNILNTQRVLGSIPMLKNINFCVYHPIYIKLKILIIVLVNLMNEVGYLLEFWSFVTLSLEFDCPAENTTVCLFRLISQYIKIEHSEELKDTCSKYNIFINSSIFCCLIQFLSLIGVVPRRIH